MKTNRYPYRSRTYPVLCQRCDGGPFWPDEGRETVPECMLCPQGARQLVLVAGGTMVGVTLHDRGVMPALEVAALLRCGGARSLAQVRRRARSLAVELGQEVLVVELVHRPARWSADRGRRYPETTFCRVLDVAPSMAADAA